MSNISDKPFKTQNQQMKILRERNLEVKSKNKRSLEQIGYYALINGYKWPFLQRDSNGRALHPENYINRSTFDEMLSLYNFDFELRSVLYRTLLKYESLLKAEISYRFSEEYPEEHSYLAIDNYSRCPRKMTDVVKVINYLSSTLNTYSSKPYNNAIKHYVNNHGQVPLWVLSNYLTFGNINYFYKVITDKIRIKIANDFKKMHLREYRLQNMESLSPDLIDSMNKVVNLFRNTVAHGNITYSMSLLHGAKTGKIVRKLHLNTIYRPCSQTGVFELIVCLKLFIQHNEYKRLVKSIIQLIDNYKDKFNSISFNVILQDMHFPENYKEILEF